VHPQKCGILNFRGGANGGKASCGRGMKTFGEVISELRKERGLTQKALAAQVKKKDGIAIGIAYINDIEHDRRNPPSPRFRGAVGGGVGSTTRGSAVLRRTAPFGQENRRSFS
jgi:transcriptional regulator with XRE-family HTH domain